MFAGTQSAAPLASICGRERVPSALNERDHWTMRMHMCSFPHLTNAFSKKVETHAHAVALHFMYYKFVRVHQTLKVTPAMQAGLTDKL